MDTNNISSLVPNNGLVSNEQTELVLAELQKKKNGDNIKHAINTIYIDNSTKIMQQIGSARP